MNEPETGGLWPAFSRLVSIPWVSAFAMRLATVVDRPLLKLTTGRLRLSFVIPCLLLRCRGARTEKLREVPLLYVPDGDDVLVVGSGGGTEREPAWCANLRAEPRIECDRLGCTEYRKAEELAGTARELAWARAIVAYPGYTRYRERISREIPVFRLKRI